MVKVEQIKKCIEDAENGISKITEECFTIGGFTTPKIRYLMNNLGSISEHYMEIGVHRGSLFIATGYKNINLKLTGIDNFSEFSEDGTVKTEFLNNCNKFINNWDFIEQDCFNVSLKQFHHKIDLYFYDGNHSYESHRNAITYFRNILADEFILVVDDFNWKDVREGTARGIFTNKMTIIYQKQLAGADYHNGVLVALIKKT